MLRQDGQLADDHRKLAVVARLEGEADAALPLRLHLVHRAVIAAVEGMALRQDGEGEHHVLRGDRFSVVPPCAGAQVEGDGGAVLRHLNAFGEQAVFGEGLVRRPGHQRIIDQRRPRRGHPAQRERVQRVEGADGLKGHLAALRGVRVDVIEMPEVRPIFGLAIQRHAVPRHALLCLRARRSGHGGGDQPDQQSCGHTAHAPSSHRSLRGARPRFRSDNMWEG